MKPRASSWEADEERQQKVELTKAEEKRQCSSQRQKQGSDMMRNSAEEPYQSQEEPSPRWALPVPNFNSVPQIEYTACLADSQSASDGESEGAGVGRVWERVLATVRTHFWIIPILRAVKVICFQVLSEVSLNFSLKFLFGPQKLC